MTKNPVTQLKKWKSSIKNMNKIKQFHKLRNRIYKLDNKIGKIGIKPYLDIEI